MLSIAATFVAAGIQAAAQPAQASQPATDDKEKIVCVKSVATGSYMAKKQCKPARQWEAERAEAERALQRRNSRSSGSSPQP